MSSATWRDYWDLTKPEISFLVAISALAGFLFGSPDGIAGWTLFWALLGILLTSAGACTLNHVAEADLDATMKRTAGRAIPSGRIPLGRAKVFGYALAVVGVAILCPLTNPLTGILGILTGLLYLYVYTPMKRSTALNTWVGTVPGALPALGGFTAATGTLGWGGWTIFGILVAWQLPHFYALAWMYRKDYERGGFAMLTVGDETGERTAWHITGSTALLLVMSMTPLLAGVAGWVYGLGALLLGFGIMVRPALRFHRERTAPAAKKVLLATVMYVPLLVLLVVIDWLLR